jgi:hypothetical protein
VEPPVAGAGVVDGGAAPSPGWGTGVADAEPAGGADRSQGTPPAIWLDRGMQAARSLVPIA